MRELTLTEINQISGGDGQDQIVIAGILVAIIFVGIVGCAVYVCS